MNTNTTNSPFGSLNQTPGNEQTNYSVTPIQVGNAIKDGDQFVMIVKHQGDTKPQLWTSEGNQDSVQRLIKQYSSLETSSTR